MFCRFRISTGRAVETKEAKIKIAHRIVFGDVELHNKYVLTNNNATKGYAIISTSLWTADYKPVVCHFGSMNQGISVEKKISENLQQNEEWITTMNSEQVVLKQIDKNKLKDYAEARTVLQMPSECPYRAVAILQYIQKYSVTKIDGIIPLLDCFEDEHFLYLIFPLCQGGNLRALVPQRAKLTDKRLVEKREARVRIIAQKLLQILSRLHALGIFHSDLALDNIMLMNEFSGSNFERGRSTTGNIDESLLPNINQDDLCLIDFGAAFMHLSSNQRFQMKPLVPGWPRNCGKDCYLPPECYETNIPFDPAKRDVFAVGVLSLLLLGGFPPCFKSCTSNDVLYKCVTDGRLDALLRRESGPYSPSLIHFLENLLTPSIQDRPDAKTALNHAFFLKGTDLTLIEPSHRLSTRSLSVRSDRSDRFVHSTSRDDDSEQFYAENNSQSTIFLGRQQNSLSTGKNNNTTNATTIVTTTISSSST
mmetsp:Transcript_20457/g.31243  ORF Transcript_20457/g.31243 Transcript_20457/m.31243 type:complete len:478 (+) Transcript_20457:2219-3652(+)